MAQLSIMHHSPLIASILACLAVSGCTSAEIPERDNAPLVTVPPPPPITVVPQTPLPQIRPPAPLPADAGAFAKCASCHSLKPGQNGLGPSLAGVFGKPAARDPVYRYSDALRTSGLVWDAATLDRFLTRPRDLVPGNKMTFAGLKDPAQRAQIIAFIERH